MPDHPKDDPNQFPPLGRMLNRLNAPGMGRKILLALAGFCLFLVAIDFAHKKYGHFGFEYVQGVYGAIGIGFYVLVLLGGLGLRGVLRQREDYYGEYDTSAEEYPPQGLDRRASDGLPMQVAVEGASGNEVEASDAV